MRAKIITSLSAIARPGAAARRLSGRMHRWASWARALAGRFRAGRPRGMGTVLVLQRFTGRQGVVPRERTIERIVERNLMGTMLFAPRLHLTVSPVLRSTVLPGGAASPEARPGAVARTAARPGDALTRVLRVPLERAQARAMAPAAFSPALALTLAHAGRAGLPRASSKELLALAGRIAAHGQRQETPLKRPATALHRPSPPALPPEAAAEASARPRQRGPNGSPPFPAGAPGTFMGTPGELDRLTEQVMRRIDRRMDAWRERTGRVR
jgi:hypothetical protein